MRVKHFFFGFPSILLAQFLAAIPIVHFPLTPLAWADNSFQSQKFNSQKVLRQGTLWVGLQPYLGRGTTFTASAAELKLRTTGKPLLLTNDLNIRHQSKELNISWRKFALRNPYIQKRTVYGPFASFESAEKLALILREQNIQAEVAHPDEWEVWVQDEKKVSNQFPYRSITKKITHKIQPVLHTLKGEIILSGPIQIKAPDGLEFKGGIYSGPFVLQPDAYGSWTFIEKVPLERYLYGVLPHEIGSSSPLEALAAQAILARTWALANSHRFAIDGYHLCSDTQCQVYKNPQDATPAVKNAVSKTAGKFLSWNSKPIHAVYHASNGGVSASPNEAWSIDNLPYLRPRLDGDFTWQNRFLLPLRTDVDVKFFLDNQSGAYGYQHSRFRWTRQITSEDLKNMLPLFNQKNSFPNHLTVLERGDSGRVIALEVHNDADNKRIVLRRDAIRRNLPILLSNLFVLNQTKEGVWKIYGGGFGHGVGLSQAGAIDLARRGWNAKRILSHYYPGTIYRTLPDLTKDH